MLSIRSQRLIALHKVERAFAPQQVWLPSVERHEQTIAVDDVTLSIGENECLGLVGESGCGKTTLARLITRLLKPTAGTIFFENKNIWDMNHKELQQFRRSVSMIFQNQDAIFNPYMRVAKNFFKALKVHGVPRSEYQDTAKRMLGMVKLNGDILQRYPRQLAGGQKRRVSIARALVGNPKVLIGDEPLASLDAFNQNVIIDLLKELRDSLKFSMIFITHDFRRIHDLSTRIAIMYRGRVVETARTNSELYHPYSINLIRASLLQPVDENDAETIIMPGRQGCLYRNLCFIYKKLPTIKREECNHETPQLLPLIADSTKHLVACHQCKRT